MNISAIMRTLKRNRNMWVVWSMAGALVALLPSLYIWFGLFSPTNENWQHIRDYMLKESVLQSLWLVAGTGFFTIVIGVSLAWFISAYDFPLRRFLSWALVMPLAIPPYIGAYTYGSMLSYTGSIQAFMRNTLGVTPDQRFFDIMSMKGAIFIFTLFLFPYVYLIVKMFLERQSSMFIENARLLGKNPLHIFFRIVLPLAQAPIMGGVSLVAFEVLNDYGVVKHFGISSFTTAIFKTWFGMSDVDSAMRLAALLMSCVIGLFIVERLLRRRKAYSPPSGKIRPLQRRPLRGLQGIAVSAFGMLVVALSFIIPVIQLTVWAKWTYRDVLNGKFLAMLGNTLLVAFVSIALLMLFAIVVANVCRQRRSLFALILSKLLAMGYSIPGAVLSIGVLAVSISLDRKLNGVYAAWGWGENRLVISMSLIMLVAAYVIRFAAVGFNAVEAGFEKVGNRYTEASRLLGLDMTRTFFKVDLPLLKGAIWTGSILAFMEIVKELPLTLLLRPFNFDTLATKAYQYASDEQIHQAAVPSLFIIAVGIVAVWFYHVLGERRAK